MKISIFLFVAVIVGIGDSRAWASPLAKADPWAEPSAEGGPWADASADANAWADALAKANPRAESLAKAWAKAKATGDPASILPLLASAILPTLGGFLLDKITG